MKRRILLALVVAITAALPVAAQQAFGPAKPEEPSDVVGETIGTLCGAYLNQAYLSLGILADAQSKDVYELEEARELLDVHLGLAEMVEKQLLALAKSPELDKEELDAFRTLLRIAGQIKLQGETLNAAWAGDDAKAELWGKLREQTGDELDKFFGDEAGTN